VICSVLWMLRIRRRMSRRIANYFPALSRTNRSL